MSKPNFKIMQYNLTDGEGKFVYNANWAKADFAKWFSICAHAQAIGAVDAQAFYEALMAEEERQPLMYLDQKL